MPQTAPFPELQQLDASKLVDGTANLLLRLPTGTLLSNVHSNTIYSYLQINRGESWRNQSARGALI